jgi:hypothetical protein
MRVADHSTNLNSILLKELLASTLLRGFVFGVLTPRCHMFECVEFSDGYRFAVTCLEVLHLDESWHCRHQCIHALVEDSQLFKVCVLAQPGTEYDTTMVHLLSERVRRAMGLERLQYRGFRGAKNNRSAFW